MQENKIKGTILIIPDIEGVYWGRGVGYKLEKVEVDKNLVYMWIDDENRGVA